MDYESHAGALHRDEFGALLVGPGSARRQSTR
jgi:hypothetical protein